MLETSSEPLPFQIQCNFMVLHEDPYPQHAFIVMKKIQRHIGCLNPKEVTSEALSPIQIQINEDLKPFFLVGVFNNLSHPVHVSLHIHIRHLRVDLEDVHPRFTRPWLDFLWTVCGGTTEEAWTALRRRILHPIGTYP